MSFNRKWILVLILIFVATIILGALAGYWLFRHTSLQLPIRNQMATVRLPEPIQARANIANNLDILVKGELSTLVPINQTIEVPVQDTLHTIISFDNDVPIKMNVPIQISLPLDQNIHVDSKVQVTVLGKELTLPIKGDIPVKAQIPLNLKVPIDQKVRLKFVAPADATLKQHLQIPLKTKIDTTIPIQGAMQVPVKSALNTQVIIEQPITATITHSDLTIPLNHLQLGRLKQQVDTGAQAGNKAVP